MRLVPTALFLSASFFRADAQEQKDRGNCQILENRVINNRFVLVAFPLTLKFGLKRTFWSQANCVPREMIINTVEGGKFTLTFTDK